MHKVIGYIVSWVLYGLGDLVSRPMNWFEFMWWLYPAYNNLMTWSYAVQAWGGDCGPWRDCNE